MFRLTNCLVSMCNQIQPQTDNSHSLIRLWTFLLRMDLIQLYLTQRTQIIHYYCHMQCDNRHFVAKVMYDQYDGWIPNEYFSNIIRRNINNTFSIHMVKWKIILIVRFNQQQKTKQNNTIYSWKWFMAYVVA